ncbi:6-phosphofructo-2-kinase-domain-containing protein [Dichotomocladium elegans]|nr:6-phosphofructo-2-kinase-domain-containing protein [Dichotomocladium elegans]
MHSLFSHLFSSCNKPRRRRRRSMQDRHLHSKEAPSSEVPRSMTNGRASPTLFPLSPCCTPTSTRSVESRWSEAMNPNDGFTKPANEEWVTMTPSNDNCHLSVRPDYIRAHGFDVPGAVQSIVTPKTSREPHSDSKLVIIMVGLPARGKSYIVKKLRRYLNWLQYETKVFNVGNLRRVNQESQQHNQSAGFFDPNNEEAKRIRDKLALDVLDDLIKWLSEGGRVAIHDATNSTIERRFLLLNKLQEYPQIKVLLMESVCTDQKILERNFRLKLLGPDYRDRPAAEALADFKSRVANYEKAYQPVGDWEEKHDIQYCKLINVGKKVIAYNISGYLSGQCVFYLMNFNLADRQIFLTRHGQSEDNIVGRIGGDAPLSALGKKYAKALSKFIKEQRITFALDLVKQQEELEEQWASKGLAPMDEKPPLYRQKSNANQQQFTIWTSMLERAKQTAEPFDPDEYDIKHIRFLNEINAAICEGMTYDEIEKKYPNEYMHRRANKLYYRYPGIGGESYLDVIHRTQSMIIELERMSESCLIVTHRVVMRILMGYLLDRSREEMPHMDIPMHT